MRRNACVPLQYWSGLLVAFTSMISPSVDKPNVDGWAARIALLALQNQLNGVEVNASQGILLNGRGPISFETAATQLVELPKPVSCKVARGKDRLAVTCRALSDPLEMRLMRARNRTSEVLEQRVREGYGPLNSDLSILVRAGEGELVCTVRGLREYLRQYLIAGSVSIHAADQSTRAAGASALVIVHPPTPVEAHGLF